MADKPKKKCVISREDFSVQAEPVVVSVNGVEMTADVKEFSTGSFGWYLSQKTQVKVGGKQVPVQMSVNMTVVGSKEAS